MDKDSFNIKVKYIPRDSDLTKIMSDKKFDERFLDVATVSEFLKGCSKPKVQVINAENRTLFGSIQQSNICCCSDPDFQLINNLNYCKYRVATEGCQYAYCCCARCDVCLTTPVDYAILDSTHTQILGNILKSEFSDRDKEMLTYRIIFPIDATPEEKILIICTGLTIDYFNYRELGKRKKTN